MGISPKSLWNAERKSKETEMVSEEHTLVSDMEKNHREKVGKGVDEEEAIENELSSGEDTEGRLDRALEYVRSKKGRPEEMPPSSIQNAIVRSLEKCPNRSCTLKSLTTRVLRELEVRTRGNPRLEFEKRVMRGLEILKRKELVEEYKSKNRRIRLLDNYERSLMF